MDVTIPQKIEVAKAALLSDFLALLKVDVSSKAPGEYPLIDTISLMTVQ